jgi:hypothetical protein
MATSSDPTLTYKTYLHYSVALNRLLEQMYASQAQLAQQVVSSSAFQTLAQFNTSSTARLAECLRMAWHTEMLLDSLLQYPRLLPYQLPWSMVQRYYSILHMIHAYFLTTKGIIEENHPATLKAINSDLARHGDLFPSPWRAVVSGDNSLGNLQFSNIQPPLPPPLRNALYSPDTADPWRYFALLLKTTHAKKIDGLVHNWKKKYQRKITKADRRHFIAPKLTPTSVFDFFFRLRIRSNYQDVDLFYLPYVDDADLARWQKAISKTLAYTLTLFECIIAKSIGKTPYQKILNDSLLPSRTIGKQTTCLAHQRWQLFKGYL